MKKFGLVLIFLFIALGVLAYLNPNIVAWVKKTMGTASTSTKVYKWQDKDGKWQVTNEPPPPGVKYQEQEYLNDMNVIPAAKDKDKK
jgi:hypothetical protein